eukprot:COSAG02_NODE_3716_length_6329_cov_11.179133_5_plen_878_part_00
MENGGDEWESSWMVLDGSSDNESGSWSGSPSMSTDDSEEFLWKAVDYQELSTDFGTDLDSGSSEPGAGTDSTACASGWDDVAGTSGTSSLGRADALGRWDTASDTSTSAVLTPESAAPAAFDSGYAGRGSGGGDEVLSADVAIMLPLLGGHWPARDRSEPTQATGKGGKSSRGTSTVPAMVGSTKRQRRCTHRGLDFEAAYGLLVGVVPTVYPVRPDRLRAIQERQIFVERPPERRAWGGGDRWRNSGGLRGGAVVWVTETHGVRKRYGTLIRGDGRPQLGFQQFSLVVRDSGAADDAQVTEDSSAYVYAVEGCAPDEVEEPLPDLPMKEGRKPRRRRVKGATRAPVKAKAAAKHKTSVLPARPVLAAAPDTDLLVPAAEQPKVGRGDDKVAMLDFMELSHQRRWKEETFGAVNLGASDFKWSVHARSSRQWPLGKATLAAASSLMVLAVVAFLGLDWPAAPNTPASGAVSCPVGHYRPHSDILADCMTCTKCSLKGLVELLECTMDRDAVCGINQDLAALLAIKATQAEELTATWGGMAQWSADSLPCGNIDSQGTDWPGCQCDSIDKRVATISVTQGVDITAPMDIGLVANLTALRYIGFSSKEAIYGDIQSLSSLVELRWLDLRGTSVHGLVSGLASLLHIGECWELHGGSPGGSPPCYPQYDGALLLAGSHVHGSVSQLQALPGLGPSWRPDAAGGNSTSPDYIRQGSFSSCAMFKGCGILHKMKDPASHAGDDAHACCIPNDHTVILSDGTLVCGMSDPLSACADGLVCPVGTTAIPDAMCSTCACSSVDTDTCCVANGVDPTSVACSGSNGNGEPDPVNHYNMTCKQMNLGTGDWTRPQDCATDLIRKRGICGSYCGMCGGASVARRTQQN